MLPVPWHDFDGDRAEKFVSVLLLREFPDGVRQRTAQGDGGIDVIVPVADNPPAYDVYQIKKYFEPLKSDQKNKIKKSAERLKGQVISGSLSVRKWHLTLPVNPSGADLTWLEGLFSDLSVQPRWKGKEYLEGLCAKYRDVVDYYILGGQERLNELVKLAMSLQPSVVADGDAGLDADSIYRNIRGVFDKLNSDDPHYRYGFAMLNGPIDYTASPPSAVMSEFRGPADDNGPILRIDVYPRYRQALEDRPITTQVTFRVPHSEAEVRDSVERFNIFG